MKCVVHEPCRAKPIGYFQISDGTKLYACKKGFDEWKGTWKKWVKLK